MDVKQAYELVLRPAYLILPPRMESTKASVVVLACGYQESKFKDRVQVGGPARGFFQFEEGGGVKGVLNHPTTRLTAENVCSVRHVAPTPDAVYDALPRDDVLAAAFARLLVYTDPGALPEIDDVQGAWALYARLWRPGKPRPDDWPESHRLAVEAVS